MLLAEGCEIVHPSGKDRSRALMEGHSEADRPSPPLTSEVPWTAPPRPLIAQPQLRVVIFSNPFTSLQAP